jgi:hypothetical protein
MSDSRLTRRPSIRKSELGSTLAVLKKHGLEPCALDSLPGGGFRIHLIPLPAEGATAELDQELKEFEARNGR